MGILAVHGRIDVVVDLVQCDDVIARFRSRSIDQNLVELGLLVPTGRWILKVRICHRVILVIVRH